VGVHDDEQRPAQPVESVDKQRPEVALFRILQEPPALRPLVDRDRVRYTVVGVDARDV
jgi:hypothetical protein